MVKCSRCHIDKIEQWRDENGMCETCMLNVEAMQDRASIGDW